MTQFTLPELIVTAAQINLFDTDLYQECWRRYLSRNFNITARSDRMAVWQKPLRESLPVKKLQFAGWNTDWAQPFQQKHVDHLLDISHQWEWDTFKISLEVPQMNLTSTTAFSILVDAGYKPFLLKNDLKEYKISLEDGWEGYLESRSSSRRKSIRRLLKQATQHGVRFVSVPSETPLVPYLEQFMELYIQYWKEKIGSCYLENLSEQLMLLSWLSRLNLEKRLHILETWHEDQRLNICIGMTYQDTYYAFYTINSGDKLEFSPGILGMLNEIQYASALGYSWLNLGIGQEAYKRSYATHAQPYTTLMMPNPRSLFGKGYAAWHQANLEPGLEQISVSDLKLQPETLKDS